MNQTVAPSLPSKADIKRLWDSPARVVTGPAKRKPPMTPYEASAATFRWLRWIAGYRRSAAMARLYSLDPETLRLNARGETIPRPATWRRLCRDAEWRRDLRFNWSTVTGRLVDRLMLADRTLLPVEEMPGELDELPDHHDLLGSVGIVTAMARSKAAEMVGLGLSEREKWRRYAEMVLWGLMDYPVVMLVDLDWEERHATWDTDYSFRSKQGYRRVPLPADPFDLIAGPLPS